MRRLRARSCPQGERKRTGSRCVAGSVIRCSEIRDALEQRTNECAAHSYSRLCSRRGCVAPHRGGASLGSSSLCDDGLEGRPRDRVLSCEGADAVRSAAGVSEGVRGRLSQREGETFPCGWRTAQAMTTWVVRSESALSRHFPPRIRILSSRSRTANATAASAAAEPPEGARSTVATTPRKSESSGSRRCSGVRASSPQPAAAAAACAAGDSSSDPQSASIANSDDGSGGVRSRGMSPLSMLFFEKTGCEWRRAGRRREEGESAPQLRSPEQRRRSAAGGGGRKSARGSGEGALKRHAPSGCGRRLSAR